LLDVARQAVTRAGDDFALIVHDWSHLDFRRHDSKRDRIVLGNDQEIGYELLTSLLLSDRDGRPLAPVVLRLQAAAGVYSSQHDTVQAPDSQLDELGPVMNCIAAQQLAGDAVHLIDREADSVFHYRQWDDGGHWFVVRADDSRLVRHAGVERPLTAVADALRQAQAFQRRGEVAYDGQPAEQYVAEAAVTLERPAHLHRVIDGRRRRRLIPGRPLPLRLIVSEIQAADGTVLARWFLLSNVPAWVAAATVALWYYWRWQVEMFHPHYPSSNSLYHGWQAA
jgi:hypothetical protein